MRKGKRIEEEEGEKKGRVKREGKRKDICEKEDDERGGKRRD